MDEKNNEESPSVLTKKVGNIEPERKKLVPAQVTIVGIREETEKPDGSKYKLPLIKFLCKHPDKPEPIQISKVKVLIGEIDSDEGQKAVTKTAWGVTDKEGNIQMGSALDDALKFFEVDCLADIEAKTCHTVVESKESSFLCLKLFT